MKKNWLLKLLSTLTVFVLSQAQALAQKDSSEDSEYKIWQATIEVYQVDSHSKHLDPILYAQRQAEIMLSRGTLLQVVEDLLVDKKRGVTIEEAVKFLSNSYSYKISKGGLIQLQCRLPTNQESMGMTLTEAIIKSHVSLANQRESEGREREIARLIGLIQSREDRVEDFRVRLYKFAKSLEIKMNADIEKLEYQDSLRLKRFQNELQIELSVLQGFRSRIEALKSENKEPKRLEVHAKPHLVE